MYSYFRLYEHGAIFKSFFCLFIFQLGLSLKNDQWSRTGERHAGFVIKQLFLQAIICHLFNFFKNQFWWHVLVSFNYNNQTFVSKLWDGCFNDQKSIFIFYFFIKKKKKNYTGSLGQLFHSNLILLKRRTIHYICIILSRME